MSEQRYGTFLVPGGRQLLAPPLSGKGGGFQEDFLGVLEITVITRFQLTPGGILITLNTLSLNSPDILGSSFSLIPIPGEKQLRHRKPRQLDP